MAETDLRTAAQQVLAHVQEFKRRWMAVPPFGNKVNKATREAVTLAHVPVLQLEEALRAALERPEQDSPPRQMPKWMDYDPATDVLTIHGRRYSAAMFGERGFLSPAGTLLQVAEGQPDCVTLMTVAALEQPEQDTDCHAQGICQRTGYGIGQPEQEPVVVNAEALELISEAAEVLDKVRVSCDAWEKYGLRDYLPDELAGTAGMLRDGSALVHPPRREWRGLTEEEVFHVENNVPDSVISDRQWTVYFASALDAALRSKNHE